MTYNEVLIETVVGQCLYNFVHGQSRIHRYYWKVPRLKHRNNTALCQFTEKCDRISCTQYQYKTGPMCSRCVDGYASPVYSYSFDCVECKDNKYNCLKYIAVAFLPLTIFYIIVILFRISGALNGYIRLDVSTYNNTSICQINQQIWLNTRILLHMVGCMES